MDKAPDWQKVLLRAVEIPKKDESMQQVRRLAANALKETEGTKTDLEKAETALLFFKRKIEAGNIKNLNPKAQEFCKRVIGKIDEALKKENTAGVKIQKLQEVFRVKK